MFNRIPEIRVTELKTRLDDGETIFILDVREPEEYEIANIGGTLIPLGELPDRLEELEEKKSGEIVVMCRTGSRSAQAVSFLTQSGYENVVNLKGGIWAWSEKVDPTVVKY